MQGELAIDTAPPHTFFATPSTNISILLTLTLSVAVAVIVTNVEVVIEVGECETETVGAVVSPPVIV